MPEARMPQPPSNQRARMLAALALVAVAASLAACGSSSKSADSSAGSKGGGGVVHPVVIQGVQRFPLIVMEKHGIAAKYHLTIKPIAAATDDAARLQFQAPSFDVGLGSWASAAALRADGHQVTVEAPLFGYTNEILVPKDSPIHSISQLKGKRIGMFGGAAGGTTLMFRLICKRFYGFDPVTDSHAFFAAPGLLASQVRSGQLDAALLLDPLITKLLQGGRVRSIGNLGQLWRQHTGQQSPLLVTALVSAKWAKANPDLAKRWIAAFDEAVSYMKTHPSVWTELGASVGIKSPAGIAQLRKRVAPALTTTWNASIIKRQQAFAKQLAATFSDIGAFPKQIPSGTFSTALEPSN